MRTGLRTCIIVLGLCCLSGSAQSTRRLQLVLPAGRSPGDLAVAGVLVSDIGLTNAPVPSSTTPVWLAVTFPGSVEAAIARCAASSCRGLALIVAEVPGDAPAHDTLAPLLERKRQGEELATRVRNIRRQLPKGRELAICAPAADIRPETSRGTCIAVADLVRDGTLDAVLLSGLPSFNFHRLRLLRDRPLLAGVFAEGRNTNVLCADLAAATENPTAETFWVWQDVKGDVAQVISAALAAAEGERQVQRRIAEAIAEGALVPVLSVESSAGNNQATIHGVGQTFVPKTSGRCKAVQIYAALRGGPEGLPSPLVVEVRDDAGDKPGTTVLAKGTIPAAAFGQEPAYRWGTVGFEDAPMLDLGKTYWIHLPDAKGYVWRMVGKGATSDTHAWSRRYDYTEHSWVLKVLVDVKEE